MRLANRKTRQRERALAIAECELNELEREIATLDPVEDAEDLAMKRHEADMIRAWIEDWPDNMMTPEEVWG